MFLDIIKNFKSSFSNNISHRKVNSNSLIIILISGLLLRIIISFISDCNYHFDEIFQYLEQVHRLVFGYGFIPWEYRFGVRSWIIPFFISIFLYPFKLLNINNSVVYIQFIKIIFCIISLSQIYCSYFIGKKLFSEKVGLISAIFVSFWYEIVYFSSKATPEVIGGYCLIASITFLLGEKKYKNAIFFGIFSGITLVIRFHFLPAIFCIFIIFLFFNDLKKNLIAFSSFIIIIFLAGLLDFFTWGGFFFSYYNYYILNKIYNISNLFGIQPIEYYIGVLTLISTGLFAISGILGIIRLKKSWLLVLILFLIIVPHSFIPHKEYRFIFPCIILLLIILADGINFILDKLKINQYLTYIISISLILFFSIFSSLNLLPYQNEIYRGTIYKKDSMFQALKYLNKEKDVKSIYNIYDAWYETGGYYYLHKNIPIYIEDHLNQKQKDNLQKYITHIICKNNFSLIKGYKTIYKINDLEIRKLIDIDKKIENLNIDTKNPKFDIIEAHIEPKIKKINHVIININN